MFKKNNNKIDIYTPAMGKIKLLSEVNDEMFSKGMVGVGLAIEPRDSFVYSPVAGVITMIFPTKHAIGIKTTTGLELIIHIGIDTVKLKGSGFKVFVKANDKVTPGTKLVEVDYSVIDNAGLQKDVLCVITNSKSFSLIQENHKFVRVGEKVAICD